MLAKNKEMLKKITQKIVLDGDVEEVVTIITTEDLKRREKCNGVEAEEEGEAREEGITIIITDFMIIHSIVSRTKIKKNNKE